MDHSSLSAKKVQLELDAQIGTALPLSKDGVSNGSSRHDLEREQRQTVCAAEQFISLNEAYDELEGMVGQGDAAAYFALQRLLLQLTCKPALERIRSTRTTDDYRLLLSDIVRETFAGFRLDTGELPGSIAESPKKFKAALAFTSLYAVPFLATQPGRHPYYDNR